MVEGGGGGDPSHTEEYFAATISHVYSQFSYPAIDCQIRGVVGMLGI